MRIVNAVIHSSIERMIMKSSSHLFMQYLRNSEHILDFSLILYVPGAARNSIVAAVALLSLSALGRTFVSALNVA